MTGAQSLRADRESRIGGRAAEGVLVVWSTLRLPTAIAAQVRVTGTGHVVSFGPSRNIGQTVASCGRAVRSVSARFVRNPCLDERSFPHRERRDSEEAMKNFVQKVQRFLTSEDGPTAVEYAVMLALIVVVCLTSITAIGTNANSTFNNIAGKVGTTTAS